MRTIRTKIYKFEELSSDAQAKAIDNLRDINVDYDWWQFTYYNAQEIGLKITSFDLDRNRHAKGNFLLSANEVAQNVLSNHGVECETYKTAQNFMNDWQPIFNDYLDENSENYESGELENKLSELEEDFLNNLLKDYSIILQNECDYLQTDEAVKETIVANEYEFTKDGKMYFNP